MITYNCLYVEYMSSQGNFVSTVLRKTGIVIVCIYISSFPLHEYHMKTWLKATMLQISGYEN